MLLLMACYEQKQLSTDLNDAVTTYEIDELRYIAY